MPRLRLTRSGTGLLPTLLVAGLSGLAFSLAFPPIDAGWVAVPALVPLIWTIRRSGPGRAAALGAVFGLTSYGAILSWVGLFGRAPYVLLIGLSAAFTAAFAACAPALWRDRHPIRSSFALGAGWVVVEWFRGAWPFGGLTWGQVASSQLEVPVIRLAPYAGAWAVSFAVVLAASLLVVAWEQRTRGTQATVLASLALATILAPGVLPGFTADGRPLDVASIQLDVRRWRPLPGRDEDLAVAAAHVQVHATVPSDAPDLIVWGEGALDPGATTDAYVMAQVAAVVRSGGVPTLIGAVTVDADGSERTAALLYGADGSLVDTYAKVHLVPFGEYVPGRRLLSWYRAIEQIPVDRVPGPAARAMSVDGLPALGAPICFENAFADIPRAMVRDGAEFLVLTINNASYEETAASRQHLLMSRLRAIETGRWVIHAAISGMSALISPQGAVTTSLGLFEDGIMRGTIAASQRRTPYVAAGDWFPVACLALAAAVIATRRGRRAMLHPTPPRLEGRVLVVIPTYDESATIAEVVTRTLATSDLVDILVVDDGSPDGTAAIVRGLPGHGERVRLRERPRKSGLASAYVEGFGIAIAQGYGVVVEMDADLSHAPEDLPRLLEALQTAHLVIGSRYVDGGGVSDWSRLRLGLSRAGNAYARWALGFDVRDATGGYRAFRTGELERLLAQRVTADGYAFQIEMAYRAWCHGLRIREVPIIFAERAGGVSKMSRRIVAEALVLLGVWGLRARFRGHPAPPSSPITDVMTS